MALSRLLLLLWMVASEVWDVETRPIDFVCSRASRKALNIVAEMESSLSDCDGSTTLSAAVKLPCTGLHIASWENKSHQEKRGDIVASLQLLIEGVRAVKVLSRPGCGTSLLQRLENNINNYLLILTHLELSVFLPQDEKMIGVHTFPIRQLFLKVTQKLEGPVESPALSCVPGSTQSLSTVLLTYNRLISGKLERFMDDLADRCTPK